MTYATMHTHRSDADRRSRVMRLTLIRLVWLAVVGLVLTLFIASIPTYLAYLHTLGTGIITNLTSGRLTPSGVRELHRLGLSVDFYAVYNLVLNAIFVVGFLLVGSVLFWRKTHDRMALYTSFTLVIFPISFLFQTTILPSAWLPLVHAVSFVGGLNFSLFLYLFPNGQFVPHWTRWLVIGWIIQEAVNDFLPALPFPALYFFKNVLFFALLVSVFVAQIYRYRQVSTPLERQQTRWVVFGLTVAIIGFLSVIIPGTFFPALFQPGTTLYFVGDTAIHLFLLCIPFSIGVAILRYRLWDIDIIINRTLVYSVLTLSVVGIYILVVGYLGALFRTGGNLLISLIATGLVAVLFQPLRGWLQRGVNRLMYGQRDEPYAVVAQLGRRLEHTLAPEAVLPAIVETVAQALKLPYTAILLKQGDGFQPAAVYGTSVEMSLTLPLVYQAEPIGQLVLGPRQRGEAFSPTDRQLLEDLARQVGIAAHAVRLTHDLQRSREQLVTAREEERRRLRRDLHDGLGSTLTSLMFKLDATDTLLDRDSQAARALLGEVRSQMQFSIADIRRLVYNLRPPTLDEWGLVGALREHVAQSALNDLHVTIEAPETLAPLPAAVEVAIYRITVEALANVVKHAQANVCTIRLALEADGLTLEVQDDGVSRPVGTPAGVGTLAMRERAAELGGTCVIEDIAPHGTRVAVHIPIRKV